jgi:hypothetical protein
MATTRLTDTERAAILIDLKAGMSCGPTPVHRPAARVRSHRPVHAEQRAIPPVRCSARSSRTGQRCRAWAVRGLNVCIAHGGASAASRRAADRRIERAMAEREVRQAAAALGGSRDVDSLDVIVERVHEAAANVEVMRAMVGDEASVRAVYDDRGRPYTNPVLAFYNEERDRLARFAKLALDAGVDERRLRVSEAQAARLGVAWDRASDDAAYVEAVQAGDVEAAKRAHRAALARALQSGPR